MSWAQKKIPTSLLIFLYFIIVVFEYNSIKYYIYNLTDKMDNLIHIQSVTYSKTKKDYIFNQF